MTRQATDQLYIELDYYYPEEYYTYEAEAVAAVSSSATVDCSVLVIKNASCVLSSTATQTTVAVKTVDAVINQVSLFTPSISAVITTSASTDLTSNFVMISQFDLVLGTNVTLETIVTLSLQAARTGSANADLSSVASSETNAVSIRNVDTAFLSTSSVSVDNIRVRPGSADLTSSIDIASSIDIFRNHSADLSLDSQLATSVIRIQQGQIDLVANGGQLILVQATRDLVADLTSASSFACNSTVIRSAQASFSAETNHAIEFIRFRNNTIDLAASSNLTTIISKLTGYGSNLSASSQQTVLANAIREVPAALASTTTVVCEGIRPVFYSANLTSQFALDIKKLYWVKTVSSPITVSTMLTGPVRIDSSLNVYVASNDDNVNNKFLTKLSKNGDIVWSIYQSTHSIVNSKMGPDNRLYAIVNSGSTYSILKFDTDGTVMLSKTLPNTLVDLTFDNDGNIYVLGSLTTSGTFLGSPTTFTRSRVFKVNSSGAIVYQAQVLDYAVDVSSTPKAIKFQSNKLVIAGYLSNPFFARTAIAKYDLDQPENSVMVRFSGPRLGDPQPTFANGTPPNSLALDFAGNIYITTDNQLMKFSSQLSFQWARILKNNPSTNDIGRDVHVDEFNNVVVKVQRIVIPETGGFYNSNQVYIFNPNGGTKHQYELQYNNPGNTTGPFLDLDNLRNIYISGRDTSQGGFVAKLPPDALGLGVYEGWYYQTTNRVFDSTTVSSAVDTVDFTTTSASSTNLSLTWNSQSTFTQDIVEIFLDGIDVIVNISGMQAEATMLCQTAITKPTSSSLVATSTLAVTATDFIKGQADLIVTGSKLTVAVKTGRTLVTLESSAALAITVKTDFSGSASLTSAATVVTEAIKTARAQSDLSSETQLVAVNKRLRDNTIQGVATSQLACVAVKTARPVANLLSDSTLFVDPYTTYEGDANLIVNSQQSADINAIFAGQSNILAVNTVTTSISKTTDFIISMTAFDFVLAEGLKITIDPYYELVVSIETGQKKIQQETGILVVDSENRLNTVLAENATLYVPSETSTWHIPYSPQIGARRVK
jgi:hypothetical protein